MLTRKTWPMALSVVFVGSVAVLVHDEEILPPAQSPRLPAESAGVKSSIAARKPVEAKELGSISKNRLEPEIG